MIVNRYKTLHPNVTYKIERGGVVTAVAENEKEKQILFMLVEWPGYVKAHGRDLIAFERYCKGRGLDEAEVTLDDVKEACGLTYTPLKYQTT